MKNQTEYVKHTFAPVYDSSSRDDRGEEEYASGS